MFPDNFVKLIPAVVVPVHQPPPASDPPAGSVPLRSKLLDSVMVIRLQWHYSCDVTDMNMKHF